MLPILQIEGEPYTCCTNNDENTLFQLGLCCIAIALKRPSVCCKTQGQCCCLVESAALPPDGETKPVCAFAGLVCYPKVGCLMKNKDLGGGPPTVETMVR